MSADPDDYDFDLYDGLQLAAARLVLAGYPDSARIVREVADQVRVRPEARLLRMDTELDLLTWGVAP